jgi:hypothetical protein
MAPHCHRRRLPRDYHGATVNGLRQHEVYMCALGEENIRESGSGMFLRGKETRCWASVCVRRNDPSRARRRGASRE